MFFTTPLAVRDHNLEFIDSANKALNDPVRWCLDGNCHDTNYGGKDRLHYRGCDCPAARPEVLTRLIEVASNQIKAINIRWKAYSSAEFAVLDDMLANTIEYMCDAPRIDMTALTVASTERDEETHMYRVSVSFEDFWKSIDGHRRYVLERNAEEARVSAERDKVSRAARVANKLVTKLMNDDLSKFTDSDINCLSTSLQTLANISLNEKEN